MKTFDRILGIAVMSVGAALSACGGGSGSTTNGGVDLSSASPRRGVTPTPATASADSGNTVPIVVDTSMGSVNQPAITITLCPPGAGDTSQCVTVKNMLVDTGSVGVRVASSALTAALKAQLSTQAGATDDSTGTAPIVECAQFAAGFTWGAIRRADVAIGGKKASNVAIQVIGDGGYTVPDDCSSRGGPNLGSLLGADGTQAFNGVVGIGHFVRDLAPAAKAVMPGGYYYCSSANACAATRVPLNEQVMNPVAAFPTNNNGTIIRLPALPAGGQSRVTGELVFGVGSQQNNAMPANPSILRVDKNGFFTTRYQGRVIMYSAIDSGTNGIAFQDATIPVTSEWYTPANPRTLSATMESTNGTGEPVIVPFTIGNATSVMASGYAAYDNLGIYVPTLSGYDSSNASSLSIETFLWGMPFFYGRDVYTVFEGATVGPQGGPFVAF